MRQDRTPLRTRNAVGSRALASRSPTASHPQDYTRRDGHHGIRRTLHIEPNVPNRPRRFFHFGRLLELPPATRTHEDHHSSCSQGADARANLLGDGSHGTNPFPPGTQSLCKRSEGHGRFRASLVGPFAPLMTIIRILHVSDLHASATNEVDQGRILQEMLKDVEKLHLDNPITIGIISGDLAHRGTLDEFLLAQKLLIDPLQLRLDLTPERIILLPGNHDIDRSLICKYEEAGLGSALTDREALDVLLSDPGDIANATRRLEAWDLFHEDFYQSVAKPPEPIAPFAFVHRLTIEGVSVGIAALNSAWRASGGPADKGRLLVGERQATAALTAIADCRIRVAAVHHPLDWLQPWDAEAVRREFERSNIIALSGHDHVPNPHNVSHAAGTAVYGHAGCLYQNIERHNSYTIIDVPAAADSVLFNVRTWWPKRYEFDAASDLAKDGRVTFPFGADSGISTGPAPMIIDAVQWAAEHVSQINLVERVAPTPTSIADVLVTPRFWPRPYREIIASRSVDDAAKKETVDTTTILRDERIVLVSGDPDSGVTSALIWLVASDFHLRGLRLPVLVQYETQINNKYLDKSIRRELATLGRAVPAGSDIPPVTVAIDEVSTYAFRPPLVCRDFVWGGVVMERGASACGTCSGPVFAGVSHRGA